jgi:hypothetical protein
VRRGHLSVEVFQPISLPFLLWHTGCE